VELAERLFELGNLSSAMAVMSGLQVTSFFVIVIIIIIIIIIVIIIIIIITIIIIIIITIIISSVAAMWSWLRGCSSSGTSRRLWPSCPAFR
jgi:hypothetical protein